MRILPIISITIVSTSLFALSGANKLLEEASKFKKDNSKLEKVETISKESLNYYTDFKIDNPFAAYLFSLLNEGQVEFKKKWIATILKNNFKEALGQLPDIEKRVSFKNDHKLQATKVYLYWRLGYVQSFFQTWSESYLNSSAYRHKAFTILDKYLTPHGGKFVAENNILFSKNQEGDFLNRKGKKGFAKEISYAFSLRSGEKSLQALMQMPRGHALEVPMGYSAAYYLAKNERIGDAGRILKSRMETAIEKSGSTKDLSKYYLLIARLLYQARAFEAAQNYYERIPNGDENYLQAQAELVWIYLHLDKTDIMRGKLETLTSKLFNEEFIPESYVVRAISNLKLCRYENLHKDFSDFINNNKLWAKKISKAKREKKYDLAFAANYFIKKSERAVKNLSFEIKEINQLAWESKNKDYWQTHRDSLEKDLRNSSLVLKSEYKKYYTTLNKKLRSAIVKMRFVKIEALDQLSRWKTAQNKLSNTEEDSVSMKQASISKGKVIFPYDGVYWPDETFHLRSLAKSRCHNQTKAKE